MLVEEQAQGSSAESLVRVASPETARTLRQFQAVFSFRQLHPKNALRLRRAALCFQLATFSKRRSSSVAGIPQRPDAVTDAAKRRGRRRAPKVGVEPPVKQVSEARWTWCSAWVLRSGSLGTVHTVVTETGLVKLIA